MPKCIHAYMHVKCIHAYMPKCIHAYMPKCIHAYMPKCIHAYMPKCIHAYIPKYIHAYMPKCIHAYMHQYMHTFGPYIYTYIYIYVHTYAQRWARILDSFCTPLGWRPSGDESERCAEAVGSMDFGSISWAGMKRKPKSGVMILTVSGGVIKVRKCGCFPLTHHLGGDFDHGKIMRPESWKPIVLGTDSYFWETPFLAWEVLGGPSRFVWITPFLAYECRSKLEVSPN